MTHYEHRKPLGEDERDVHRVSTEGDDYYIRMRAEDRSLWAKFAYVTEKYKAFVWLMFALLTALGFGFKTPKQAMADMKDELKADIKTSVTNLQAQIDTIKLRQDASFNDRVDQRKMLEFNTRVMCASMSVAERERLGGTEACEAANNPIRHAIEAKIRAPGEPGP